MTATDLEVAIVLGTRPEIIKFAPIVHECERRDVRYSIVHTGQHYSHDLDSVFFEQLELPMPEYNLGVGSGSHGEQTAAIVEGIERILLERDPAVTLVQGDTNSTLGGAIVASKLDTELGHVEAGLRSFDETMPEETNRKITDHVADYLFPPTDESARHLRDEGIDPDRITVTGNTIVDAVQHYRSLAARKSSVLDTNGVAAGEFLLLTAHRAENVDDPARFRNLLTGVARVADAVDAPVLYPIHPRAEDRLDEFGIDVPDRIRVVEPQDFLDFLRLEEAARLVLTDSGGVQEEACILETPCVTLRDNTERPETVEVGANVIAGTEPSGIRRATREMIDTDTDWTVPFGDGDAARRIVGVVRGRSVSRLDGVHR